jgi:hypothetical protein
MKIRKGPSQSATLFKEGTVKKGNDGNKWIIIINKLGVHRWQKTGSNSKTMKMIPNTKSKSNSKTKSNTKHVLNMEADPDTVWGKNKPLEEFWKELASGKKVVLIEKNGDYKIFIMPTGKMTIRKMYNSFDDDENIISVLSSNMSQDAYEVHLYPKAKDKTVEYVIKNYKKYFKSAGPTPKDMLDKGFPAQEKVLFPA